MDNETEKLYGYTVVENRTKVTLIKENRALMSFDKRLFREVPLASWRLARVDRAEIEHIEWLVEESNARNRYQC